MTNNGNQPETLTVTPISEWNQGELVQLPSGFVVRCVNVDILPLFTSDDGDMPDVFMQFIMQPNQQITEDKSSGLFEALSAILPRLCKAVISEPKVTDEPTPNSIAVSRITLEDKMFLFQRAMGGLVKQGGNFPTEQARNVASLQDVSAMANDTQQRSRARGK